jgi:hypothetical protein
MEQLKRAGSPLAHKRVSKAPASKDIKGGPQQQTAVQRLGSDPSAEQLAAVQRHAAELQAINDAQSAAARVARDSRVSLRRVAALVALIAIGLSPAGGWGTALSGGLAGPVAGPVAGPFALHLASGGAGGLPAVLKACRKHLSTVLPARAREAAAPPGCCPTPSCCPTPHLAWSWALLTSPGLRGGKGWGGGSRREPQAAVTVSHRRQPTRGVPNPCAIALLYARAAPLAAPGQAAR